MADHIIDFSDSAEPHAHFCVPYETRVAYIAMRQAERRFIVGAHNASGLPFERRADVAALCRARLLPELYAGLTRNTSTVLAEHVCIARYGDLCITPN
jgi:hypothetical protein